MIRQFVFYTTLLMLLLSCAPYQEFKQHQRFVDDYIVGGEGIKHHYLEVAPLKVHYATKGSAKDGIVLWLHGTPGNWKEPGKLFVNQSFLDRFMLVSVDRPGWGESTMTSNANVDMTQVVLASGERLDIVSYKGQTQLLGKVVDRLRRDFPNKPIVVVGFSYGGSIALALANEKAAKIDGVVGIAGGYSPSLMKTRWYHRLSEKGTVHNMLSDEWKHANREMLLLPDTLESLVERWDVLSEMPIFLLQGGKDSLVPADNPEFVRYKLGGGKNYVSYYVDEDYGHLWSIQRTEAITSCIEAMFDNDFPNCVDSIKAARGGKR